MAEQQWPNVPLLVEQMYNAQNGKCGYCGTPDMYLRKNVTRKFRQGNKHTMATFEHVNPRSDGGRYEIENGVCICSRCNGLRGRLPVEEFFERYEELLAYRLAKPARDAAKKLINARSNGYRIAWFAMHTGQTVDDVFLTYTPNNSYDIANRGYYG